MIIFFASVACGKAYKTLAICKSHQKRVHGEKIWKCSFCVKAFSTKEVIIGHSGKSIMNHDDLSLN